MILGKILVSKLFRIIVIYLGAASLLFIWADDCDAKVSSRIVKCDESKMIEVFIKPNFSTIINFPVKPDNVVLGGKNQFAIEYIKSDLALTALTSTSKTNLFVYLFGRRCGFELIAGNSRNDNLILVRDPEDAKIKVIVK